MSWIQKFLLFACTIFQLVCFFWLHFRLPWFQDFWEQEPGELFLLSHYLNILILYFLMVCVFENTVLQTSFMTLHVAGLHRDSLSSLHVSLCGSGSPVSISFSSDLQYGEDLLPSTSPHFVCVSWKDSLPPWKHTPSFLLTLERVQVFIWAKLSLLLGESKVTCTYDSPAKIKDWVQRKLSSPRPRVERCWMAVFKYIITWDSVWHFLSIDWY